MRKLIFAIVLAAASALGAVQSAHAGPTAAAIFDSIGGTTTIDQGGSIHSQARSIYSLGGGMTTFTGKRVSLLAADPPSFSAGCSGISWHFGGFSFISADEIRQLVEAVSQASLGVAVDLAMQTLCPQCYAVMSKLRDMANSMRNAAADSCNVAKNFGSMLQSQGIFTAAGRKSSCAQLTADSGTSDSWLSGQLSPCKLLNDAESTVNAWGDKVLDFMGTGNKSAGASNQVTKDDIDASGNITYDALTNLGYEDGFVKDMLLSFMGMTIVEPTSQSDCSTTLAHTVGSTVEDATSADPSVNTLLGVINKPGQVDGQGSTPTPDKAVTTPAQATPAGTLKGKQLCFAPPLVEGLKTMAEKLICGFNPVADMNTFANTFNLHGVALQDTTLGAMCQVKNLTATIGQFTHGNKDSNDPLMYQCDRAGTNACVRPKMVRMSAAINDSAINQKYTGLAWMIMDALYQGLTDIRNNQPLKESTLKIVNGSGYPLYRLMNLAAVYPGTADEMLQAYGGIISTHYAVDTIERLMRPADASVQIKLSSGKALNREEQVRMRTDIMNILHFAGPLRQNFQQRLSEKRALVDSIVQVNRSLQAEVISSGLLGNADMALSIKKQQTK